MPSAAFRRMATASATTKRNPAAVAGKIAVPVAHLAAFAILPLMPITPQIAEYYRISSPREVYVTYTQEVTDVLEGDVLTTGGADYRVTGAGPWPTDNNYIEIVIQKVKGT